MSCGLHLTQAGVVDVVHKELGRHPELALGLERCEQALRRDMLAEQLL